MSHLSARFRFALTTALVAGAATLALQPASAAVPTSAAPAYGTIADEPAAAVPALPVEPVPATRTRYCVIEEALPGSIIDRKICRTRAQWLEEGFDPLEHHRR